METAELNDKVLSLSPIQAQQERLVNNMIQFTVDMQLDDVESLLDAYIMPRGIENTIIQIIFPFLERIGILWITNQINPAQEHLITNIIRQKLILGIESCSSKSSTKKSFLLFLPEGEHHELGLLFTHYLLKSRGIKVIYIGANVPIDDVLYVAKCMKPDFIYTHLTSVANSFQFDKFLAQLHQGISKIPIIISGHLTLQHKKKVPVNVHFKKSLAEVTDFISSLE
jgi:methanogenic corrinoid protein MtbC1